MMDINQTLLLALQVCEAHSRRMKALVQYSEVFIQISEHEGERPKLIGRLKRDQQSLATLGERADRLLAWATGMTVCGPKNRLDLEGFALMFAAVAAAMAKFEPSCRTVCSYVYSKIADHLEATKA
jgi:hypothetical protein